MVLAKSPLCLPNLVMLGIACALHTTESFSSILTATLKLLEDQQDFYVSELGKAKRNAARRERKKTGKNKHDPRRGDPTVVSEEAFVQARRRMPFSFWINLIIVLGEKFEEQHQSLLKFHDFRVLAIDGTCIELPNWKRLRDHFGTSKNVHGLQNAQARMVMLQFPFVRLPYRYELCPLDQGETSIARRLTQHLRMNDLLLLDAGFWSYGLLWDVQNRGAFFAIPLKGKRINLTPVCTHGRDDREMIWRPQDSRRQWKKENLPKSIRLRVITYQIPGFRPQHLLTNVLRPSRISRADWVRLATDCTEKGRFQPGLFHRRWEIETTYRELKVDQNMEGNLRGRTPESIQFEIAGHVVLYHLVRTLLVEAAVKHGIDPLRLSFTNALRELLRIHAALVTAHSRWAAHLTRKNLGPNCRTPSPLPPREELSATQAIHQPQATIQASSHHPIQSQQASSQYKTTKGQNKNQSLVPLGQAQWKRELRVDAS